MKISSSGVRAKAARLGFLTAGALIASSALAQANKAVDYNYYVVDPISQDHVELVAPNLSSSYVLTLPSTIGSAGQVLSTNGTSETYWEDVLIDPGTTRGDLIRRGASSFEALAAETDNRVVRGDGIDVVSGQIDNPDFFTPGAQATASVPGIVSRESSGTFTGVMSGGFSSNPANESYSYNVVGKVLTIWCTTQQIGTSNAATNITLTGLPLTLNASVTGLARVRDNSIYQIGMASIATNGTITIRAGLSGGTNTFTTSNSKGLEGNTVMTFVLP